MVLFIRLFSFFRQLVSTLYRLQIHSPWISKSYPPDHSIHARLRIVMEYRAVEARRNAVPSNAGGTTITDKLRPRLDSFSRTFRPEVSLLVVSRWAVRRFVGVKLIIHLDQWRNLRNPCREKSFRICIMPKESTKERQVPALSMEVITMTKLAVE